jgi:xanthine dehydrogenase accessory factor
MLDILSDIERWAREGEDVALATVVGVRGSSPRPAGARLAVTRSGRMSGAVSAGCVESEVHRRAIAVLDSDKPELVRFSVTEAPELDVGLSCGGTIDVLIEPFARGAEEWRVVAEALRSDKSITIAEVVEPAHLRGATTIFGVAGEDERPSSRNGFPVELRTAIAAEAVTLLRLAGGAAITVKVPFAGGEASVFLQSFAAEPQLYIVGGTEIGAALCKLAKVMGMRVAIVDPRAAYSAGERFPEADEVLRAWPNEALCSRRLGPSSAVVTLTHDAKLDIPALACALRSEAGYIGALGSRRTHEKRKAALAAEGFAAADIARVHGPVGLDIGGTSAAEIALSIIAEISAARNGRDPRARAFVSGVILAAGASTRMGRPKQLLSFGDKPLLQHVVDAAATSRLDEVIVVLGAHAGEVRRALVLPDNGKVRVVVNPAYGKGLAESVRCGIAAAASRASAVAILLGDQPRVSAALIDQVLAAHVAAGKPATRPVFGAGDARTPGHPVILSRSLWQALRDLRGDEGARAILAERPEEVNEVRIISSAPADIDTPEDYAHAIAGSTVS